MPQYSSKTHLVPRSLCEHASKEGVHVTGVHGCAVLLDALHIAEDEGLQLKGLLNASQRQIASAGTCRQARAPRRSNGECPRYLMQAGACHWQPPRLHKFRSLAGDAPDTC